jgi:hypothetical protein
MVTRFRSQSLLSKPLPVMFSRLTPVDASLPVLKLPAASILTVTVTVPDAWPTPLSISTTALVPDLAAAAARRQVSEVSLIPRTAQVARPIVTVTAPADTPKPVPLSVKSTVELAAAKLKVDGDAEASVGSAVALALKAKVQLAPSAWAQLPTAPFTRTCGAGRGAGARRQAQAASGGRGRQLQQRSSYSRPSGL